MTLSRSVEKELIEQLQRHPYKFDFEACVRCLERINWRHESSEAHAGQPWAGLPNWKADLGFSSVRSLRRFGHPVGKVGFDKWTNVVATHIGLTGAMGVLPIDWTELTISEGDHDRPVLRDFLNVFDNRTIWHYVRAKERTRFVFGWERAVESKGDQIRSPFTHAVHAIHGLANDREMTSDRLRQEIGHHANVVISHSQLLMGQPSRGKLETVLNSVFASLFRSVGPECRAKLEDFVGKWLSIPLRYQTVLGKRNTQLDNSFVLGERAYDWQSTLRIRVGPLDFENYRRFLPDGDLFRKMSDLVRIATGNRLSLRIAPVLDREKSLTPNADEHGAEDARTQLGKSRLCRDAWLLTSQPSQHLADADFLVP